MRPSRGTIAKLQGFFQKGLRGRLGLSPGELPELVEWFEGARQQFIRSSFATEGMLAVGLPGAAMQLGARALAPFVKWFESFGFDAPWKSMDHGPWTMDCSKLEDAILQKWVDMPGGTSAFEEAAKWADGAANNKLKYQLQFVSHAVSIQVDLAKAEALRRKLTAAAKLRQRRLTEDMVTMIQDFHSRFNAFEHFHQTEVGSLCFSSPRVTHHADTLHALVVVHELRASSSAEVGRVDSELGCIFHRDMARVAETLISACADWKAKRETLCYEEKEVGLLVGNQKYDSIGGLSSGARTWIRPRRPASTRSAPPLILAKPAQNHMAPPAAPAAPAPPVAAAAPPPDMAMPPTGSRRAAHRVRHRLAGSA